MTLSSALGCNAHRLKLSPQDALSHVGFRMTGHITGEVVQMAPAVQRESFDPTLDYC